jgi:hypothetical protein
MYFLRPHDLAEGQYTRRRIPIPLLHGLSTTVKLRFRIPENFYSIQYSRGRTDPQLSHARRKVLFTDNENTSGTLSDVIARYGQSLDRDESAKRHLRRHHLLHPLGLLAKPLRIPGGAVEHRCRFEQLELAARCRFRRFSQNRLHLGFGHRAEAARRLECLLENLHAVDASDNYRSRQV